MPPKTDAGRERVALLRDAAVLRVGTAEQLLPWSRHVARAFLEDHGLVIDVEGRKVVIWGDVLEVLRRSSSRGGAASRGPLRGIQLLEGV